MRARKKRHRVARSIAIAAGVLASTWLLLEIVLIVAEPVLFRGFYQYDPELGFKVRAHTSGTNEFGFNDHEHTHEKPVTNYRILFLGDSFNWSGLRDCSYTAILQNELRYLPDGRKIEIINAG